jgi:hypothetical protein
MIESQPKFMNGVYSFVGSGYEKLAPVSDKLTYMVPPDKRAQLIFLRVGNSCAEMIYLVFMKDGTPMRYFPVGAKNALHVSLAVVEDIAPEINLLVFFAAPAAVQGSLVIDIGLLEI